MFYQQRVSKPPKKEHYIPDYRYPTHRLQIRGFHFEGSHEGRKTISIKADKFTIEKKKLGFFRLGMINMAMLRNADIDIYGKRTSPAAEKLQKTYGQIPAKPPNNKQMSRGITFKDIFQKEALPTFRHKRILSILMEPASVKLHTEQSEIIRITAASASIRLKKRDILFKGDVRVESGPKVLMTEQLKMFPENGILRTDGYFVLNISGKKWEGEGLITDLFLTMGTP